MSSKSKPPKTDSQVLLNHSHNRSTWWGMLVIIALAIVIASLISVKASSPTKTKALASTSTALTALAPANVSISSNGFVPSVINVRVNQPVVWSNSDSANHSVNSDPYPNDNYLQSLNDDQPLATGQTYTYIFSKPGVYSYHDNLNPYSFKGEVIVKN